MPHSPKTTPAPWGIHRWWLSIQSIRLRATYSTRGLHALRFISAICSLRQLSDRSLNPPGNFTISTVNLRGSRFGQAHTQGEAVTSSLAPSCLLQTITASSTGLWESLLPSRKDLLIGPDGYLTIGFSYFSRTVPGLPRVALVNQQERPVVYCHTSWAVRHTLSLKSSC